ncbi:MAG: hypothetical protein K9N55_16190 [Phycisphaerae bacterium]|nr:hypothetical protein [Phycisphaerae bacterium]
METYSKQPSAARSSETLLNDWVIQVRKVRQRMILQASLKILALGLVGIPIYVVCFAWIDHHLHLGPVLRLLALGVLLILCAVLLWQGFHLFRRHISLSCAANTVENQHCLDQQLVAAIEYHEQQDQYPYSRTLVEQMILAMEAQANTVNFRAVVPAWPTWLCSAIIVVSLLAVIQLVRTHVEYMDRYWTRLTQPTAAIAPLPATTLISRTEALVVAPQAAFQMHAILKGRRPKQGRVMIQRDPNEVEVPMLAHTLPINVTSDANGQPELIATWSLADKGLYRYCFTAGDAASPWHPITVTDFPSLEKVTAQITLGQGKAAQVSTVEIEAGQLSVFEQSEIRLTAHTNQPLLQVRAHLPQGEAIDATVDPNQGFHLTFVARETGPILFDLVNVEGHANREDQRIDLKLTVDQPPRIELLSPDGDYVATNGASIPIHFTVSDDRQLHEAQIHLEFNDGQVQSVPIHIPPDDRMAEGTVELELEDYDLQVSDSIIYYASARDSSSVKPFLHLETVTEPYFIEIRSYHQWIHQGKPGMPSQPKQGLELQGAHDGLLAVLEYTRAFLKKTWALSQKPVLDAQDKERLDAISDDIDYTAEQLTLIRNDPRYQFDDSQMEQIDRINSHFNKASGLVCTYRPQEAVAPEKEGYFELRRLIKELEKLLPPPGTNPPRQGRDKYKIEEPLHIKRYDKERLEWELEQLNQKLAELAREQDKLQQEFLNFLEQQKKTEAVTQNAHDRDSWQEEAASPSAASQASSSEENASPSASNLSTEGAQAWLEPDPNRPSPPGGGQATQQAQPGELMRMMQAQQEAMQQRLDQLTQELRSLPQQAQESQESQDPSGQPPGDGGNANRKEAETQLGQASERMEAFEKILDEQYYRPKPEAEALDTAYGLLGQAREHLLSARAALARETGDTEAVTELMIKAVAQELDALSRQYDPSVSPAEQQAMQARLAKAMEMLELMPEAGWPQAPEATLENNSGPKGRMPFSPSRGSTSGFGLPNLSEESGDEIRRQIQDLAQRFWSASLSVKKEDSPLLQPQISHPQYSEQEDLFFELSSIQHPVQEQP